MIETASILEILWTAQACTGVGLGVLLVTFWERKRRYLIRNNLNAWRMTAVLTHLIRKSFYLLCHLLFVLVGVMALLLPPRPPVDDLSRWVGTITAGVFLFVSFGMQADMIQSYRHYRRLEDVAG